MSQSEQFAQVIHEWSKVFMRHSLSDYRRFLGETGLTFPQMNVLMRLYHQGVCGISDLGQQMGVSNAAASQAVDRLVQVGLIERKEDPEDRRAKQLILTEKGKQLIEQSIAARSRWFETLAGSLDANEKQKVIEALTLLTQVARKLEMGKLEVE